MKENFRIYEKILNLRMAALYGGGKILTKQLEQLGNEPDILVATHSELDHLSQKLSLGNIEILFWTS